MSFKNKNNEIHFPKKQKLRGFKEIYTTRGVTYTSIYTKYKNWGTWVAQAIKCPTLDFSPQSGLQDMRSSSALNFVLDLKPV